MNKINHLSIYLFLAIAFLFINPKTTNAQPIAELIYLPIDTIQQIDTKPIVKQKKQKVKKIKKPTKTKSEFATWFFFSLYFAAFIVGLTLFCVGFLGHFLVLWIVGLCLEGLHLIIVGAVLYQILNVDTGEGMGGAIVMILLLLGLFIFFIANGIALFIIGFFGTWWISLIGAIVFLLGFIPVLLFRKI